MRKEERKEEEGDERKEVKEEERGKKGRQEARREEDKVALVQSYLSVRRKFYRNVDITRQYTLIILSPYFSS